MFDDFNPDEELRFTAIELSIGGHRYRFRVHNSGGIFQLFLVGHLIPDERSAATLCAHAGEHNERHDPCMSIARRASGIKDAARLSIEEHTRKFHYLTPVK